MALSAADSELIQKIVKFALHNKKLSFKAQNFPRNLAPIIEKWQNDKHPFRDDGTVLMGFCLVTQKNVEVLFKEVQETSEKILLDLKMLFSHEELSTEIGELVECDYSENKLLKFTAEKDKITIADAVSSDFWGLGATSDFEDLEIPDESLFDQISMHSDEEGPQYPLLHIDTSYLPPDSFDLPRMYQISNPNSPETLGIIQIDCSAQLPDTAPNSVLTEQNFYQESSIFSPPIPASPTMSPEPEEIMENSEKIDNSVGEIDIELQDLNEHNFCPIFTSTPKKIDEIDIIPKKKARISSSKSKISNILENYEPDNGKLDYLLNLEKFERSKLQKEFREKVRESGNCPAGKVREFPIRQYLDNLEPLKIEHRWKRAQFEEFWISQNDEDVREYSPTFSDDLEIVDDNTVSSVDDDVLEDLRDQEISNFSNFQLDSGFESMCLEDCFEKSSEDIKTELTNSLENEKKIAFTPLLSSICPSATRKSAARAFFAVLELAKMQKIDPPTQNEPFGEIYLQKNAKNC